MESNADRPKTNHGKEIRFETANLLFSGFLGRVLRINRIPEYAYFVTETTLFRSHLREQPNVRDIDLAVQLVPKAEGPRREPRARVAHAFPTKRVLETLFSP